MTNKKLTIEETAQLSMQLISIAGDSIGINKVALQKAKKGKFEEAYKLLDKAREVLSNVHLVHADIIQKDAQGIEPYINTLFIHAQDHFANSLIYNDMAKYFVDIYEKLDTLKG
jgi:cellobiose PTS system EIIA component